MNNEDLDYKLYEGTFFQCVTQLHADKSKGFEAASAKQIMMKINSDTSLVDGQDLNKMIRVWTGSFFTFCVENNVPVCYFSPPELNFAFQDVITDASAVYRLLRQNDYRLSANQIEKIRESAEHGISFRAEISELLLKDPNKEDVSYLQTRGTKGKVKELVNIVYPKQVLTNETRIKLPHLNEDIQKCKDSNFGIGRVSFLNMRSENYNLNADGRYADFTGYLVGVRRKQRY